MANILTLLPLRILNRISRRLILRNIAFNRLLLCINFDLTPLRFLSILEQFLESLERINLFALILSHCLSPALLLIELLLSVVELLSFICLFVNYVSLHLLHEAQESSTLCLLLRCLSLLRVHKMVNFLLFLDSVTVLDVHLLPDPHRRVY